MFIKNINTILPRTLSIHDFQVSLTAANNCTQMCMYVFYYKGYINLIESKLNAPKNNISQWPQLFIVLPFAFLL